MNHADSRPPLAEITAHYHPDALGRTTRAFSGSDSDILVELIQNARRAGANRIDVYLSRTGDGPDARTTVRVRDDGSGIADPALLLAYGANGWSPGLVRREDAAGLGMLSLAARGCEIRSCAPHAKLQGPWRVVLTPEHFTGAASARVEPCAVAPYPMGTDVRYHSEENPERLETLATQVAKHCQARTVRVTNHAKEDPSPRYVPYEYFLRGATYVESWEGLTFGVYRLHSAREDHHLVDNVAFYERTTRTLLPALTMDNGQYWTVRINVEDCRALELVLPARKEIAENAKLDKVREAALRTIYRALAKEPDPRAPFAIWHAASQAGIHIRAATPALKPWIPETARGWDDTQAQPLAPDALIAPALDAPMEQALARAARRNNLTQRLFRPNAAMAGYDWYDALPQVQDIEFRIRNGGAECDATEQPRSSDSGHFGFTIAERCDHITAHLHIVHADGREETLILDTDLAFADPEPSGWLHDAAPVVTRSSSIEVETLRRILFNAYHCPSDDYDADSNETQAERFREDALVVATQTLADTDTACIARLREVAARELHYLVPRNAVVHITIGEGPTTVRLEREAARA